MRKIKVGLVGSGFAANIHMTAYNENREFFEIVAVTAKHVENAKKFAERYGIPVVCE
ncbi:MAG TPA: gfo/Idh/MocA family oxidoreductase, partial [Thermotogales bacterium]|nr:gfo/Idh/MocA family oxidoreductase [Thermotogales bacterium]